MNYTAEELYSIARAVIRSYDYRYIPEEYRDDLTQEIVVGILEKIPLVELSKNPSLYLFKAGYQKGFNFITRYVFPYMGQIKSDEIPDDAPDPVDIEEVIDRDIIHQDIIRRDTKGWLTSFLGVYDTPLSVDQIVNLYDVPRSNVYRYLSRHIGRIIETHRPD